jgi:hypothetical protein
MMNVSSYFPYLTFQQFKRVIRCFNITKDALFPKHILEEHTEEDIAEFALKNKASATLNKIVEKRSSFIEKKYFESQEKIHDLQNIQKFIEGDEEFIKELESWFEVLNKHKELLIIRLILKIVEYSKSNLKKFIFPILDDEVFKDVDFTSEKYTLSKYQFNQMSSKTTVYNKYLKKLQKKCITLEYSCRRLPQDS